MFHNRRHLRCSDSRCRATPEDTGFGVVGLVTVPPAPTALALLAVDAAGL